jgi:hypothetical protein
MKTNKIRIETKAKDDLPFTCGICGEECQKLIFFGVCISVCISCLKEAVALFNLTGTGD